MDCLEIDYKKETIEESLLGYEERFLGLSSTSLNYIEFLLLNRYEGRPEKECLMNKLSSIFYLLAKPSVCIESVMQAIEELNYVAFVLLDDLMNQELSDYLHFFVLNCRSCLDLIHKEKPLLRL